MGSEADSTNLKLRELLKEVQHDYSPESTKIINDFVCSIKKAIDQIPEDLQVTADLGPGFVRDIGADKVEFKFKKPKSIEIEGSYSFQCIARPDVHVDLFLRLPKIQNQIQNTQTMNGKNITNPNSIYIPIKLSFEGYRKYTIHAYVDTGVSVCTASKWIIPKQFWVQSEKTLNLKIADNSSVKTSKVVNNIKIGIIGHYNSNLKSFLFTVSTVYQLETRIDFIIENPLDPKINRGKMTAKVEMLDEYKDRIIRAKAMAYSPSDREEFSIQIKELLDLKVIEPSKSPFSSPAFMVRKEAKKRRGKARMVINYSQLNKVTKSDGYILPNMQSLLQLVKGKTIFSSLDLKSGLHQAPGIFQRHMDNIFKLFNKFCCVYIDDILIFTDNEILHEDHVIQVLQTAKNEGIVLSKKKAELFKEKIRYLGLEIAYGHKQLKSHILTHIQEFRNEIQDQKQLMRFLGCLTYAESFIRDLAKMRSPL
ncbi:orf y [Abeliophyllum distichum]|uniref:RNA-directed DNA polymerase n=1 Tax=Abeliophyllum distichum TaxID=126358 RepID=A0ABD1SB47_9LAMI